MPRQVRRRHPRAVTVHAGESQEHGGAEREPLRHFPTPRSSQRAQGPALAERLTPEGGFELLPLGQPPFPETALAASDPFRAGFSCQGNCGARIDLARSTGGLLARARTVGIDGRSSRQGA